MAVPDRSDCSQTTRETSLSSEVFVDELSTAGGPAQPRRPRKAQLASPPVEGPSGNRKSSPGHVSLTTSALSSWGLRPAGSSFLDRGGNCGPAAAATWPRAGGLPGRGLRSRPGYEDADAPSGKESQSGLPPIPGKVWGGGLESSARRARPVTVQDTEPGQRLCPHLVDALKRLTAALMRLATDR